LKTINFHICKNIVFDKNSIKKIQYLELDETDIQFGIKYKFDNLEVLNINKSNIDIDFIVLTKIKSLKSSKIEIIENIINYSSLEKYSNLYISQLSFKEEQKLIEIILMNKTLKEIEIELNEISNKELSKYLINNQINKIKLDIKKDNFDIINFLKRFINIKELTIFYYSDNKDTFTEIKNDENICIDTINIYSNLNTILPFSFSKIKVLYLSVELLNTVSFSLFNNNCNDIFYSLEYLYIECKENTSKFEILINLSNNIMNCKNLKKLEIEILIKEMQRDSYLEFINKILAVKLHEFSFIFQIGEEWDYKLEELKNIYTKKELKIIFPNKIYDCYFYEIQKIE
jgi:hypothetical protein